MTNREKFAEQILDIACNGNLTAISKATLEPIACQELPCEDCLFYALGNGCDRNEMKKWANSEYVEPPVDWSKVAVDTPILATYSGIHRWVKGILRNMRMEQFTLGIMEQHHGVVRCAQHAN